MRTDWAVVSAVAVCIVAVVLATGPVGLVDVGTQGPDGVPGTGNATVEALSQPETVTLAPSNDGQDLLALEPPPVSVAVSNVSGNPLLSYVVALEELGTATDSVVLLGELGRSGGTVEATIDRQLFQPEAVANVTKAELTLRMRGDRTVTLFELTVPVERSGG